MRHRLLWLGIFFTFVLLTSKVFSAVTEVHVGDKLERAYLLKPGVHRYLRYTITADGHRNAIDIWSREISFETKDGRKLMRVQQQWDETGKPVVLVQDAWFEADTLRPLTQVKRLTREGTTTTSGYRFLSDKIVGMDELEGNAKKGFVQATAEPTNNWETDMEYLQALPLKEGYSASINFYDPGLDPPGRYVYSVSGSDAIATADGGRLDCWLMTIDFKDGDKVITNRYWFAKKNQVLIREEQKAADGSVLVKTLLNPEA
ncbi:MAG TPA: hypothetical protein VHS76_18140 [Steroidobacteraceae bacterium]|jgi:hypothetical protein|nr:hypothetical protein [Steroidobacteraceae bacterium]